MAQIVFLNNSPDPFSTAWTASFAREECWLQILWTRFPPSSSLVPLRWFVSRSGWCRWSSGLRSRSSSDIRLFWCPALRLSSLSVPVHSARGSGYRTDRRCRKHTVRDFHDEKRRTDPSRCCTRFAPKTNLRGRKHWESWRRKALQCD